MRDDKLQEIIELLPYSIRYSGEIEELLDYAKEQAERVQELEKRLKIYQKRSWFEDYEKVAKQNKRLREALSFYANRDNYYTDAMDKDNEGEKARQALGVGSND